MTGWSHPVTNRYLLVRADQASSAAYPGLITSSITDNR